MPCSDCATALPAEALSKSELWVAQGGISRVYGSNSQFMGAWVINERPYKFTFTLVNNVTKFDAMPASLSYHSVDNLTGICTVLGRIESNHIRLGLIGNSESGAVIAINGKSISGPTEAHPLVIGSGTWQSS